MHGLWTRLRRSTSGSSGFTLLELLIVMVLAGLVMSTASWSFVRYQRAAEERSTATRLSSTLRNAAERALSEGKTYCVYLNTAAASFDTYRQDCTDTSKRVSQARTDSTRVTLASPAFPPPATAVPNQVTACPSSGRCAYFYPRGTALAGTVQVRRDGSTKVYTVTVEGLTSRVSQS